MTSTRAVIYARISRDPAKHGKGTRQEEGAGVERQVERCTLLAQAREWDLVRDPLVDNDLSAYNGKTRPAFDELMGMIARREIDAVLIWHIDRLCRRMSDLVEIARVCQSSGVKLATVHGDFDFSSPIGRMFATILIAIAEYESAHKGERQVAANEQAAKNGKRHGGPKAFGSTPGEAAAIRWAADALLGGSTVSAVMREWTARGLATPQNHGTAWTRNSVTTIMKNPALAGLRSYNKEIVGRGDWEPIVPEETWRAVAALLGDPSRKRPRGVRTLLGGLALCRCGNTVQGTIQATGKPAYRCNPQTRGDRPGPHCQQMIAPVDEWVTAVIIARLEREDLAALIAPKRPDLAPLRREAESIRRNLEAMAADRVLGLITRSQMIVATERANARLDEITAQLAAAGSRSVLAPFAARKAARDVWKDLDDSRKRAVIDALCSITIHPAGRGARKFDPNSVTLTPRDPGDS